MRQAIRAIATLTFAAFALGALPAQAQGHHGDYHGGGDRHGGYHGGGDHGGRYYGGRGWGGWGLGIGLGIGLGALAYDSYYNPYYGPYYDPYPGYVVIQNPPPVVYAAPPTQTAAVAGPPDPVIYPRNGQSASQTEADRQACNRWATTVPSAMADGGVFQRAVEACMDARGYTMR